MPIGPEIADGVLVARAGPSEEERRSVQRWRERIDEVRRAERPMYARMRRWRELLADPETEEAPQSEILDADGNPFRRGTKRQQTNLIFGMFAAALPMIYDTDPDVSSRPSEAAAALHYELARKFARTVEIILKRLLVHDGNLKRRMKSLARATMPDSIGWLKVAYQRDYRTEPYFRKRQEDAQDEMVRLNQLIMELKEEAQPEKREEIASRIRDLRAALIGQEEILIREGVVIDRIEAEDVVVEPTVRCIAEGYREARWIAHGAWMSPGEAAELFSLTRTEREQVTVYRGRKTNRGLMAPEDGGDLSKTDFPVGHSGESGAGEMVRVWEIWDKTTLTVHTVLDGLKRFAKPPMHPPRQPQRWYPFYACAFNTVEGVRYPISDVALLEQLQSDYWDTRSKFKAHRDASIPKTAIDASKIPPHMADKFVNAPVGSIVAIQGGLQAGEPVQNAFFTPPLPPIPRAVYETTPIRFDMEQVYGLGDAHKGSIVSPKTATEAIQVDNAVRGRTSTRTDELVAVELEIARDALEILLMEVDEERAMRIAGVDAVWPKLTRAQIDDLLTIELMHSSKEDEERRRLAWLEVFPIVQQNLGTIMQLRMQGLELFAQAFVELLRETFRRFDLRLDVERFLPASPYGDFAPPELQHAAAARVGPVSPDMLAQMMTGAGLGGSQPSPPGSPSAPPIGHNGGPPMQEQADNGRL